MDRLQVILDLGEEEELELVLVVILACSQVVCLQQVGTSPVKFTQCNIL